MIAFLYTVGLLFTLGAVIAEKPRTNGVLEKTILVALVILWPVTLGFVARDLLLKALGR